MSELPHVFDATTETFEADVLRKSLDVPVLVCLLYTSPSPRDS